MLRRPSAAFKAWTEIIQIKNAMAFETESQKRELLRWSRLAIQLNGAADSGHFDHITAAAVLRECQDGNVFEFLSRELPPSVWEVSKLTDVDRHSCRSTGRCLHGRTSRLSFT
jgi:hypothetical protein